MLESSNFNAITHDTFRTSSEPYETMKNADSNKNGVVIVIISQIEFLFSERGEDVKKEYEDVGKKKGWRKY